MQADNLGIRAKNQAKMQLFDNQKITPPQFAIFQQGKNFSILGSSKTIEFSSCAN